MQGRKSIKVAPRISETPQNPGRIEVGKNFWRPSGPAPCSSGDTQNHIQAALEDRQGGRFHYLSVPSLHHLHNEVF